ncbi:MAG: caspase family protein [Desulfobacteraceae bacterium]|nr:caspase family protein [Desulfobacteraceae bacterium]
MKKIVCSRITARENKMFDQDIVKIMLWLIAVLFLIGIMGCVSTPNYSSVHPVKKMPIPARPVFSTAKLAIIFSENTQKSIEYLNRKQKEYEAEYDAKSLEDYDPYYITNELYNILGSRFNSIIQVPGLKKAKNENADLAVVLDFRLHIGTASGQRTSVELYGKFMDLDHKEIVTIKGLGGVKIPVPYTTGLKPASGKALARFIRHLDTSGRLMGELEKYVPKDQPTTYSQMPASRPERRQSGVARQNKTEKENILKQNNKVSGRAFGTYYALVIGNNNYRHLHKLRTAVNDAKTISNILEQEYGFTSRLMLNATRGDVLKAINSYRKILDKNDNLLIYYAGHGWLDKEADQGYWLPVDATHQDPTHWISNGSVTDTLRAMEAKHVLVIADSCYSGKLTRSILVSMRTETYHTKIFQKKARTVMASGGLEPVIDEAGGKAHSVFASALIEALTENQGIMDGTSLFNRIRRPVMLNSDQTPEYADIRIAGHDGGDFIFVRQKKWKK